MARKITQRLGQPDAEAATGMEVRIRYTAGETGV
jgi:hypothetical protein